VIGFVPTYYLVAVFRGPLHSPHGARACSDVQFVDASGAKS
jgi:hypothetical protein